MKRSLSDYEQGRIISLLETLREDASAVNVENLVAHRIRRLALLPAWTPIVSFRQFAWGAGVGIATIAFGALGLAVAFGPQDLRSAGAAAGAFGSALFSAVGGLAWTLFHRALEYAGRLSGNGVYLEGAVAIAGQAVLIVFAAMIVLTILVVSHDARAQRVNG